MTGLLEALTKVMLIALTLLMVAVVVFLVYLAVTEAHRPTFELVKADWSCSASHQQTSTTVVSTGKTTTVIPRTVTVCDQWTRKP